MSLREQQPFLLQQLLTLMSKCSKITRSRTVDSDWRWTDDGGQTEVRGTSHAPLPPRASSKSGSASTLVAHFVAPAQSHTPSSSSSSSSSRQQPAAAAPCRTRVCIGGPSGLRAGGSGPELLVQGKKAGDCTGTACAGEWHSGSEKMPPVAAGWLRTAGLEPDRKSRMYSYIR